MQAARFDSPNTRPRINNPQCLITITSNLWEGIKLGSFKLLFQSFLNPDQSISKNNSIREMVVVTETEKVSKITTRWKLMDCLSTKIIGGEVFNQKIYLQKKNYAHSRLNFFLSIWVKNRIGNNSYQASVFILVICWEAQRSEALISQSECGPEDLGSNPLLGKFSSREVDFEHWTAALQGWHCLFITIKKINQMSQI